MFSGAVLAREELGPVARGELVKVRARSRKKRVAVGEITTGRIDVSRLHWRLGIIRREREF